MRSAPAITFDYRPSRWVAGGVAVMALAAVAALAASGLPAWAKAAGILAALAYASLAAARLLRSPVRRCAWHSSGEWRLRDRDGADHAAQLRHATARGPLIALVLSAGALRDVALVLLPDNCDDDTRRRLRVRLARPADAADA